MAAMCWQMHFGGHLSWRLIYSGRAGDVRYKCMRWMNVRYEWLKDEGLSVGELAIRISFHTFIGRKSWWSGGAISHFSPVLTSSLGG